jgi:hypothetical protein
MKKIYTLIVLFCFISANTYSQGSTEKLGILYSKISHVKYADLNLSKAAVEAVLKSASTNNTQDLNAIIDFSKEMLGLKGVIVTDDQRNEAYSTCESICDVVNMTWSIGSFQSDLGAVGSYPFKIEFMFCDSTYLSFSYKLNVTGLTTTIARPMKRAFLANMNNPRYTDYNYIQSNNDTLRLKRKSKVIDETLLKSFLAQSSYTNKPEGVFSLYSSTTPTSINKLAIIKSGEKYQIVVLENKYFKRDWKYGDIRGELMPTSSDKLMIGKYTSLYKYAESNISYNMLNDNLFEIDFNDNKQRLTFVRVK